MSFSTQIQAKRDEYNAKVKEINHLLSENVNNVWTDEMQAKHDALADETERMGRQIENMIAAEKRRVEEEFEDVDQFRNQGGKDGKQEPVSDAKKALDIFLRKSFKDMTVEDALLIRNTMSTTTGSEGGFTVQSEVASRLIDAIKEYRFMRMVAGQITTEKGNPLSFPTSDGTSEIGEWVAQNAASSNLDPTFGTVALNVFKAGSKVVAVPIELLQDSQIDIESFVFNRLAQRIGRLSNQGYTTGTGTGQPNGVVTAASVGKIGATGQTATIIYDDLVDLIDSLDIGYQSSGRTLRFMFSQVLRRTLRKIKDTSGRPIWTPSYEAGLVGEFSDSLLGYPVTINNDMPTPAANAKSLLFGDMSQYMIRDAMEVSLFRFDDSAYMKLGQVGFLAWARTGGNLLDTGAVKLYQHSAT